MEIKAENIFKSKKAALIDMDGVLYDSMPGHTLAWKKMMDGLGVECSRDEFYLYEGMTGVATINLLFRRAFGKDCDPDRARELYAVKTRLFRELGPARLMPGADRMLKALRRGGLTRVLVTGSGQKSLLDALNRDYPGMFAPDCRVTALDVTRGKPDPEPYLRGADKAGVSPSEAIVIENAPLGVRAGKAAGCFTIAVTTGPIPREEFEREGADMIFPSMTAFAEFLESGLPETAPDSAGARIPEVLAGLGADRVFALTDSNVRRAVELDWGFADEVLEIAPGEASKDIDRACSLWERLARRGATRRSVLVNVGGGVVSDLGGFVAATFKRGIRYINVPTTLLAAADAAIGGKTGIDFMGYKNEVGAFHMPEEVIVDPSLLDTLPREETLSGFAEVVKMALLTDAELYESLLDGDVLGDKALLGRAVTAAARAKEEVVAVDPEEKGLRRILNLGHTAGHAFESLAAAKGSPVSHGVAVAHGLLVALRLSVSLKGLPEVIEKRYRERILERYYAPLPLVHGDVDALMELMDHDKKNPAVGSVSFVLLESVGKPVWSTVVDSALLRSVVEQSCDENEIRRSESVVAPDERQTEQVGD